MPNMKVRSKAAIVQMWYRNYMTDNWNGTLTEQTEDKYEGRAHSHFPVLYKQSIQQIGLENWLNITDESLFPFYAALQVKCKIV